MNRTSIATIVCVLTVTGWAAPADTGLPLANTKPLEWPEEDLSTRLMEGAHRFIEGQIRASRDQRSRFWKYDASSRQAYEASVAQNRQQLRQIIGVVDPRLPVRMEQFGDDLNPACVAETPLYRVFQVRWPVLDGVFGEGLFVQPRAVPSAHVVVVPDADQTPEQILGLAPGLMPESQFARCLAEHGFELVIPTLVSRRKLDTEDPGLKKSDQTYREWIYRQAFHMGRHIIGYEVQKVLAAVDWFEKREASAWIGVLGYAEGGLIAFYAAALDTRIDAVLVSGYFDARESVWAEPIYRNVWSLLGRFGDAEIASLILPRSLVVEYSPVPTVTGHKGDWRTPEYLSVSKEFERIPVAAGFARPVLVHNDGHPTGPGSVRALDEFAQRLGVRTPMSLSAEIPADRRSAFRPDERHNRAVQQLENHVQALVRESEHVRDRFFLYQVMPELAERRWSTQRRHDTHSVEPFTDGARRFREQFYTEAMGRFDQPLLAPNARTRRVLDTAKWAAYDVVLDVFPDLFGRLQSVDAQGRRDRPGLQFHADHRMGDAVLESRAHVRLCRDDLPDGAPALHGRARPPRHGGGRPLGGARVCQGALAVRPAWDRGAHGDRILSGRTQHQRRAHVCVPAQASELAPASKLASRPTHGFGYSFTPVVGREVLRPADDTEVLVRFADGAAAMTRHPYGKGQVYVVGFFPGLEYRATVRRLNFNMRHDSGAALRLVIAEPALRLTRPVVDASDPPVEGVLLGNPANGRRAVTLAHWAYGVTALAEDASHRRSMIVKHPPAENLQVTIRAVQGTKQVFSCMLQRTLRFTVSGDSITVELPRLDEGDVLLRKR